MISILYIDDEPLLRDLGQRFLEKPGDIQVDLAENAAAGLGKLTENRYDAIVSDYEMPDMNGIELLKHLRSSGDMIPFILFTGRGREDVAISALNQGADFYLQKGMNSCQYSELAHMIRMAVEKSRTLVEISRSRQQMADIISHLPDPTIVIDTSGIVVAWNTAIQDLTAIPASDMVGRGEYAYAIPFYGEAHPILLDYLMNPNVPIDEQYKKVTRTEKEITGSTTCTIHGTERNFWVKATLIVDHSGNITGAIESIRDTTQRVKLLHTLRNARNHFENIISHLPDPTVATDKTGKIIAWNQAMTGWSGIQRDDAMGGHCQEVSASLYASHAEMLTGCLLENREPMHSGFKEIDAAPDRMSAIIHLPETEFREETTIWSTASLLQNHSGEIYGAIESFRDITRMKKLEEELRLQKEALSAAYEELEVSQEELRESYETLAHWQQELEESEQKYRILVENSNDGIFLIQDTQYLYLNPSCSLLSEYSPEELYQAGPWSIVMEEDRPSVIHEVRQVTEGRVSRSRVNAKILTKTGDVKVVEFMFDLVDIQGKKTLFGRARDITGRIKAEQALYIANKKLHLLASITRHDIKNRLTSLHGSLSLLQSEIQDPHLKHLAGIAEEASRRIDQDISFTGIYQDIGLSEPVWANVHDVFGEHLDFAHSHAVTLSLQIPTGLEICVDPLFTKVCFNLIDNAVRHGGKISAIWISAFCVTGMMHIRIVDDGAGVKQDEKERIFHRGYGKNTGMGLFLIREILAITGIEIYEQGTPGEGALFELIVPPGGYRRCELQECRPRVRRDLQ